MTSENALAAGFKDVLRRTRTLDEFRHTWRELTEQQLLNTWVTLHLIANGEFTIAEPSGTVWYSADGGHCDTCTCPPVWIRQCDNCGTTITSHHREPPRWCSNHCRAQWRAKNRSEYPHAR